MEPHDPHSFDKRQRWALSMLTSLALLTFLMTNLQALLWQSSSWLVSTVLPAVVVSLTNDERNDAALPPLRANPALAEAAKMKAEHMAKHGYFAHFAPDGTSPWYFFREAGYTYAHAGENLAVHFTDSSEVVEAWMQSPLHKENIMGPQYTEIGIGTAKGDFEGFDTVFVVQLFGTPAAPVLAPPTPVAMEAAPSVVPERAPAPAQVPEVLPEVDEPSVIVVESETSEVVVSPASDLNLTVAAAPTEEVDVVTEDVVEVERDDTMVAAAEPVEVAQAVETVAPAAVESVGISEEVVSERQVPAEPAPAATEPIRPSAEWYVANQPEPTEILVFNNQFLSTSSGLAPLLSAAGPESRQHAGITAATFATQPHMVLQSIYLLLALATGYILGTAAVQEWRQRQFVRVAYSFGLLLVLGSVWYVHGYLTTGAVVL